MKAVYLVPFGAIDDEVLSVLEIGLWQIFGCEVKRLTPLDEPEYAFDPATRQHNSALLLKALVRSIPADALRVLGVTHCDLFIPMLSFVFGHAQVNGPAAVISLARLHQEFYGVGKNHQLFLHRVIKEAVHELGHTFGLIHCSDTTCAMSLSNSIQQVDVKSEELCSNCSILFEESLKQIRRMNGGEKYA